MFVVSLRDIDDEVRAREALVHAVGHDPLTGLPFPGNVIPADRLNAIGLKIASAQPTADTQVDNGSSNFSMTDILPNKAYQLTTKIDHHFNSKVAVSGFCWGGGQSFRFATQRKDLSAAFVFYGPPPQSGMENMASHVRDRWLFGAGPFQDGEIHDAAWSGDSKWIAFAAPTAAGML